MQGWGERWAREVVCEQMEEGLAGLLVSKAVHTPILQSGLGSVPPKRPTVRVILLVLFQVPYMHEYKASRFPPEVIPQKMGLF